MLTKSTVQLMALGLVGSFAATAAAQDSGALIDALVRKGVLKDQEAEQIRTQLSRDYAANTPAGKLNLSSSVKELKLSGDVRLRFQHDISQVQANDLKADGTAGTPSVASSNDAQRDRYRLRLRVNADYKLNDNFYAGFGLQTTQNNDSGNQTMGDGNYHQNYSIFINKAFIGWTPVPGVTVVGGKQVNPFYTTDVVWDADINPSGFVQRVDLHKILELGGFEVSLVAGQFVVSDSTTEKDKSSESNRDAFTYQAQVQLGIPVGDVAKVTIAPGFYWTNGAKINGDGGGEYNSTKWSATGANQLDGMKILLVPGDVSFKLGSLPAKFQWDFAYNRDGADRGRMYAANVATFVPSSQDNMAYLAGFQVGENKKKGDWSALVNYRQVGLAAVDPNINDSDWSLSYTNMAGYKAGFFYNLGDATTVGATYYQGNNLRKDLGGNVFKYGPGSQMNSVQVLQVDVNVKF